MIHISGGPCGEKVGHYTEIKSAPVPPDAAEKTFIRWLISKKDGAPTFAMRLFDVEAGGKIAPHYHPWEHEIFILEGEGRIRIGSKWYDFTKGSFIYVPPNVEHEYINTGNGTLRFICVIPNEPSTTEKGPLKC